MKRVLFLLSFMFILTLNSSEILLIGIAGGTGAGKTTIARKIYDEFKDQAIIISQDNYYKDLTHLSLHERSLVNFDHPDSIDFDLLVTDLQRLKENKETLIPLYDFCTHSRKAEKQLLKPQRVIILEGILLFCIPELRNIF